MIVFDKFVQFIQKYSYLWGGVMILLGFVCCFFGNKLVNFVIFAVTALAVFVIVGALSFQMFLKNVTEDWQQWLFAAIILAIAFTAGWGVMKLRKWGIGVVAGWGGVMIGFVLTAAFLIKNVYAYWATIAACAGICFYIAIKVEKIVIIVMTSFIGAYVMVRGVSFYIGGFPSEMELRTELEDGVIDWENYDKKFFYYLGGMAAATLIGIVYQKRNEEKLNKSLR